MRLLYRETKQYFLRNNKLLGLGRGSTQVNLYKLFVERFFQLKNQTSHTYFTIIIPGGILGDLSGKPIREKVFNENQVSDILEIITGKSFFPRVHSGLSCVILSATNGRTENYDIFAKIRNPTDLKLVKVGQSGVHCNRSLITNYSEDHFLVPMLNTQKETQVLKKIYKFPILNSEYWTASFTEGFHRRDDSKYFDSIKTNYPLIEGNALARFGVEKVLTKYYVDPKKVDLATYKRTKTFNHEYIGWRDISGNDYRRRMYASLFPKNSVTSDTVFHLYNIPNNTYRFVCACLNSLVIEFRVRQVAYGLHVRRYVVGLLPIPQFNKSNKLILKIEEKVVEFEPIGDKWARKNFGATIRQRIQNEWEHTEKLAEIDALVALVYDLNMGDFKVVLNAHPKVWREYKEKCVYYFEKYVKELDLENGFLADDTGISFENDPVYSGAVKT